MVGVNENNASAHQNSIQDNSEANADASINDIDVEAKLLENGEVPKNIKNGKKNEKSEQDQKVTNDINKLLETMPLTEDNTCGFWIFKGAFFQKFANQTAYVVLYGIVGCVFSMTYAYFNGIITTIEKRFKIPSRNTGIISVGNDISQMLCSAVLSYYAGKGHRPRWIGFGLLTIVIFCMLSAAPHFLYGPGEDALGLTFEFGAQPDENATLDIIEQQATKTLCKHRDGGGECVQAGVNSAPQIVLFIAQLISGIGSSLYYTLGVSYMDDNTKKSKTPALLSLSYFLRMLGPAIGYALASFCLRLYIEPQLRPVINNQDPRWLGAWWMGWLIIGGVLFFFGIFLTMFPKELPRATARRMVEEEHRKQRAILMEKTVADEKEQLAAIAGLAEKTEADTKASVKDMLKTFKRLTTNKTLMCNNLSSVFYLFGYTPYWIFTPKYIEIQYRQSAATSSMVTGTVALAFSAIGVLLSGFVISRYKPTARYMAAWNVIVGFLTVIGIVSYAFIGCPGNENSVIVNIHDSALNSTPTCNSDCYCDYVRYSPVCGENNMTYISPCHAGCRKQQLSANGIMQYSDCACVPPMTTGIENSTAIFEETLSTITSNNMNNNDTAISSMSLGNVLPTGGSALIGACPVNCFTQFVTFLSVMCLLKFVGATGRASNFLVSVRCVPEKDKTAAMGFGMMMMSMLAFIPSPIFFGWVLDRLCLVWGKTCTNKGNCWLYNPESLRYILNFTAAAFVMLGTLFDCGVWYYVKDLKIFDEKVQEVELKIIQHEEEVNAEKQTEI